mmetsp:Transcript_10348/g.34177  ORF Transcript_10348/g.34177 Transcript_10348/m.34177 type:complete len:232 (-) Transcript_10348:1278-1973(-)
MGTRTIEWRRWGGASAGTVAPVALPMKMQTSQRGSIAPEVHHLRPFKTSKPSPSSRIVASRFVGSELATPGSVMPKQLRISPSSNGRSHRAFWASVPNWAMTSMFPVSGALQLKISGATRDRPMASQTGAYSAIFDRPPPRYSSDASWYFPDPDRSSCAADCRKNRFQRPSALAFSLSSVIRGDGVHRSLLSFSYARSSFSCGRISSSTNVRTRPTRSDLLFDDDEEKDRL